jgi:hypothetical protein
VKARALIANASYGPNDLKILGKAFDDAWAQIAPNVSSRADAIDAARYRLATMILGLANNASPLDAQRLTDAAVQMMHANLTKLRP